VSDSEDVLGRIDETSREEIEGDLRRFAVPALIKFHADRIAELKGIADQLVLSDLAHNLGLFLTEDAKAHQQINEWAARALSQPCPPYSDREGADFWVTCLRLLKRHAAAWSWHPDYWSAWLPEDVAGIDESTGTGVWTQTELLLAEQQEKEIDKA
jgi:hypothetical protein